MNTHITDAQVEAAIDNIGKIVEAASNSNQAGEDALMMANAAPQLYAALAGLIGMDASFIGATFIERIDAAKAALAKARGETT